jgi:hypothetical protein
MTKHDILNDKHIRKQIYTKALELVSSKRWNYCCDAIAIATDIVIGKGFFMRTSLVTACFPEFAKFEPITKIYTGFNSSIALWWPKGDTESRIKALEQCIKECE